MALTPGARLGVYEVTAQIGEGGMGRVYRATDTKLKRQVAIKVLPPSLAADHDRLARFQREAEVLASLNHPNIATIHGLEESGGVTALVMELVEGEDLSQRIAKGAIPLDEALSIAKQIAEALEAAHEQGIIHRDLKPANIKVRADGTVKVLDFGLAKTIDPRRRAFDLSSPTITSPAMTEAGVILGTAAYMSPEQARGKAVDKRADVWGFGCVLFEMLTGRRAFGGESVTDTIAAVISNEPDLDALPAITPARVSQALRVCLRKDPKQRVGDIRDVRLALDGAFETHAPQTDRPALQPSWRVRIPWVVATAAVLLAAVLTIPVARRLREAAPNALPVRFEIPVTDAPLQQSMAVSPDGRHLVYVAASGANRNALWLRSLDALDGKMLDGTTEGNRTFMAPAWSPDSRSVAFVADGKLKKIDVRGGTAETLVTLDSQVGGISWNREGVILFASNDHGLRRVAAPGGPLATVTERDASLDETFHDCPTFLPDGRHFVYLAYSELKPENRAAYIGSLDSSTRTRLMASDSCVTYAAPGFVVFSQGQTLMARPFDAGGLKFVGDAVPIVEGVATFSEGELAAFAVSDGGTLVYRKGALSEAARSLVWMDRNGKASDTVGAPIQPGVGPTVRLSPDGQRAAFSTPIEGGRDDIWTLDLQRNIRLRLTSDPDVDHIPVWSPDGSRVVFDSHRGGHGSALYEVPASGAVPERLLLKGEGEFIAASDWSPDGRFLVFHKSPVGGPPWSIWVLPLVGDGKPSPYKVSAADNIGARLSPNGRWLAYTTNESGTYQVVVQPFPDPSGGKWQVSSSGGTMPVWRHDGREIYYLAPSGDLIAVAMNADSTLAIGKSTMLFHTPLPSTAQGTAYDATADGLRFLLAIPIGNASPPMTTILNWASLVTKEE